MYPWVRDAALNAAASAIGFGGGHHLHQHQLTAGPNGFPHQAAPADYATHNKKAAAAAFLWSNGPNDGGPSGGVNHQQQQQSPNSPPVHQQHHLQHQQQRVNGNTTPSGSPSPTPPPNRNQQQGNANSLINWMASQISTHHSIEHTGGGGIHYTWNNAPIEGKLNSPESHHNSIKSVDASSPQISSVYGLGRSAGGSGSSASSSPPSSAGLVVPQPLGHHPQHIKLQSHGHAINGPSTTGGRKYQCKMCPQIFTSKADLQLHTQIHMREAKPYKCNQCSKSFANSSYLSQHTRIHLGIKPYRCEICERKFTQLSHLQQHIRTHTGDKPYKCRHPGCNKAFSQLSNLQSHSRCHQTDKPYKCNSCYKCFQDESSLLDHIPKHKESKHLKTHICNYCGKSYTQETYLAKHMQKHTEKAEKRQNRHNNHHNQNGTNSNQSHVNGGGQHNSNSGVMSSPEMYWGGGGGKGGGSGGGSGEMGGEAASPPPMCLPPLGGHRGGSEGPDDLRVQHHQNTTPSPYDALANAIASSKAAGVSAFTPIQTGGMLQMAAGQMGGGGGRAYLPYEPLSFQKGVHHGHHQMTMEGMKGGGASFPNQLISLHQIRNYAHQPSPMTQDHLLGLKDK